MQQMAQDDETLNEVNVIPLADLSLVLLIILMVLSPMVTQALIQVSAQKPAAAIAQEELTTPEVPIIVSYEPGALKLNGTLMGSDLEFVKRLDEKMVNRKDKTVIMTASPDLSHGKVVRLMDVCKQHGAENLVMAKWDPAANAPEVAEAPANPIKKLAQRLKRGHRSS